MTEFIHKILYRTLSLEGYLCVVSRMFFVCYRLGIGRHSSATEYVFHLPQLVRKGDTAIDIGANLGYYARPLCELTGTEGMVWAVEPVAPIRKVLSRNLRRCGNVEILPFALGTEDKPIVMANDSVRQTGYFGTGRNFVNDHHIAAQAEFMAEMRRGSELFASLTRLDFVKCDIEGYEVAVMYEMRPLLEKFRPTVLIETGGENRLRIITLFTEMGYKGFTLENGAEVPLSEDSAKDIIFRPTGV